MLAAIVYLVWKRQNLIGAMFTGHKPLDHVAEAGKPAPTLTFASGRLAVSLLIAAAAIVYFIVGLRLKLREARPCLGGGPPLG